MSTERESLKPIEGASRPSRRRIGLRGEFAFWTLARAGGR
jgi:hypothetical protein